MIVASLLLILVAVVMLALGLLGGANGYLVGSIVASLFAAIALVVSGRRATWAEAPWRRGVDRPAPGAPGRIDDDLREPATAETELVTAGARSVPAARAEAVPLGLVTVGGGPERRSGAVTGSGGTRSGDLPPTDRGPAGTDEDRERADDRTPEPDDRADAVDDTVIASDPEPAPPPAVEPGPVHDAPTAAVVDDPVVTDEPAVAGEPATSDEPAVADEPEAVDDADDEMVDEPPVQLTPPGDAARVARAETEVHVIDGRPRYHLRRCVHLLGRASEPLPAHEAVALGFTPCALCEPDTWIAAQARRGG